MEKVKSMQLSILLINTALNMCVNRDTFRRRMTTSTACFDCLAYSSNRIVLPGQLPGDLNVLQHIWMDPPATFSIHVGPSPVNLITRQTVRVEQLSILSIIEANKVVPFDPSRHPVIFPMIT